ncbi:hypothetical protein Aduo_016390 [Ancylostoma duodenale]
MHVGVISWYHEILLLQVCCRLISEACTVFDRGPGLKTVSLQQFSVSDLSGTLGNLISSVTSVAGMPLNGVLPLETLTASSSECPMECLTTLTAYTDKLQGTLVMLRPEDVRVFPGYTALDAPVMFCATSQGYCGSDVPLFLYYSDSNRDYYVGVQSNIQPTYSIQHQGNPLCYVWSNSSSSTTTSSITTTVTTATTTAAIAADTSTAVVTFATSDNTTSAYNSTTTSAFTTSSNWVLSENSTAAWNSTTTTQPFTVNLTSPIDNSTSTTTVATTTSTLVYTTVTGVSTTTLSTTTTTVTGSTTAWFNTTTPLNPETKEKGSQEPKKKSFNFWPLVLAGMVGLGVLVITISSIEVSSSRFLWIILVSQGGKFQLFNSIFQLALSTITIIRSGRRALIRPQKNSPSPPPPYPYTPDGSTDLPPAPVSAMSAPQPFTVNPTMDIPFVPPNV